MSLYDAHTQAVTHVMDIGSSEVKSQYTVRGLKPGTRFRLKAVVTRFFKDLSVYVKQSLYTGAETGTGQIWAADRVNKYHLMTIPFF